MPWTTIETSTAAMQVQTTSPCSRAPSAPDETIMAA
jgi:hypothetical protein